MLDQLPATIARYWRGEEPLWKSFWVFGIFVPSLPATFIGTGCRLSLRSLDVEIEAFGFFYTLSELLGSLIIIGVALCYAFWNFITVWRSAPNVDTPILGWVARGIYLSVALLAVAVIIEYAVY